MNYINKIIDENKQLKHEKETVEELLRPFQKNDRYTNETKSPYTIREILQENEKLKKIQKSLGTIVGSKEEEEIESKVKELFETKKKIESNEQDQFFHRKSWTCQHVFQI